MTGLTGAVVWAVVPFVPQSPFRIYAGEGHAPLVVEGPGRLVSAARRGGDSELSFIVTAKARPVLVLADRRDERLGELLGLRLLRLGKLTENERLRILAHEEPGLFPLPSERFPDLGEENAAMVGGLVRVHHTAADQVPLGHLDRAGLRLLYERVVRHHGFDLRGLVRAEIERLAEEQSRRPD